MPHMSLVLGSPTLSLQSLQEGNDVYLDCEIRANPPPSRPVTWKLDARPLLPTKGQAVLSNFCQTNRHEDDDRRDYE
jgi:hypothetical protein